MKKIVEVINKINITLKWLGAAVSISLSRFRRRYNQHVIYEHRVFNVRGLRTRGTFTLEIEQVFVELRIAPSHNSEQINFDPISAKQVTGNRPIWDFWRFTRHKRLLLAIIGAPGCGKTTLLQYMALIFAANKQRQYYLLPYVPILLFLRNHIEQIVVEKSSGRDAPLGLAELIYEHFANQENYPKLKPPRRWFEQRLKKGKCLVLLDGLDEVADLKQRQAVSAWVEKQIIEYSRCHFIITARPQGYLSAPVEGVQVLEVQPFNTAQVQRFIDAWYLANEITAFGGKTDEGVRHRAKQGARDLMQRLREAPTLSALTVNPLLLTMIAMVHRYRGQLPGRRVELYAEISEVLLGHWAAGKGIQNALTAAQKRVVLQPLAFQMMRHKARTIDTENAMKIIALPLERVGVTGEAVQNFLSDVQASSGLLLERESMQWSFAHLTFQEYLAATHILDNKLKINWQKSVNNSWWYETFLLYAAQTDATPVVQACLDNGNVSALTLAANCLEEARALEMSVRVAVQNRLTADLESSESQRRKLAAEVRLSQRLKSLQRIDEDYDIDLNYITYAEYQLFLDESRAESQYYQPDHWTRYTFHKGTAQAAVCGIRALDAEAFCAWLTRRQGGSVRYRLPSLAEAKEHPATSETKELATLCRTEDSYELSWLTKNNEQRAYTHIKKFSRLLFPQNYVVVDIKNITSNLEHADLAINRAIGHALALVRTQIFARATALALARDFAHDLAPALVRSSFDDLMRALHSFDKVGPPHSDRYTYALTSARATINRALTNARASVEYAILDNDTLVYDALDRTSEALDAFDDKDGNPRYAVDRANNAVDSARYAIDRNFVRNRALAHARVLARADPNSNICKAIENDDLQQAQQLAQAKQTESNPTIQRVAALLSDLLICATATSLQEMRQAWRKYVARIAETIWIGYNELERREKMPLRSKSSYAEEKELILKVHWWLRIIIAREEGNLSAWEGIRIVRERNTM